MVIKIRRKNGFVRIQGGWRRKRPGIATARLARRVSTVLNIDNRALGRRLKVSAWSIWMWQNGVVVPSEKRVVQLKALLKRG